MLFNKNGIRSLVRPDVVALAVPVIIEQILLQTMGSVNVMLSSRLSPASAAAIGMIDGISSVIVFFLSSLALGTTVLVAHLRGRNDNAGIYDISRQSYVFQALVGTILCLLLFVFREPVLWFLYPSAEMVVRTQALAYFEFAVFVYPLAAMVSVISSALRGIGNTRDPARVMIIMNVMSVVLSASLIYGIPLGNDRFAFGFQGLGIRGAALGLLLSWMLATVLHIRNLRRLIPAPLKRTVMQAVQSFRFVKVHVMAFLRVGLPSGIEAAFFASGKLLAQTFIVSMGTVAAAANTIGFSMLNLMVLPGLALGVVATTMTGQILGRGDMKATRDLVRYLVVGGTVFVTLIVALVNLFWLEWLAGLYNPDPAIVAQVVLVSRYMLPFMPVWGLSFILPAALKGAGDARYTLLVSMLTMWTVRVVAGYVLGIVMGMGLLGVWLGMYADWVLRALFYGLRYRGQTWMNLKIIGTA